MVVASPTISVTVDGIPVTVPAGYSALDAVNAAGVPLSQLCKDADMPAIGACRTCLVQIDGIRGFPASLLHAGRRRHGHSAPTRTTPDASAPGSSSSRSAWWAKATDPRDPAKDTVCCRMQPGCTAYPQHDGIPARASQPMNPTRCSIWPWTPASSAPVASTPASPATSSSAQSTCWAPARRLVSPPPATSRWAKASAPRAANASACAPPARSA